MYEKLSDVFRAVAFKKLTAVDIPKENARGKGSNQHEIGGLVKAGFASFLGTPQGSEVLHFNATMLYLDDDEDSLLVHEDKVSWYDTRAGKASRGPELRLYYTSNEVTGAARQDDLFLIALTRTNELFIIFCAHDSEVEYQLRVIFGAHEQTPGDNLQKVAFTEHEIAIPIRTMLSRLGVELFAPKVEDPDKLERIRNEFGDKFPSTREFSTFARSTTDDDVDSQVNPDKTLLVWLEEEEHLFRLLERHIVSVRLSEGFGVHGDDVDEFIKFSLGVQNRRKSRAGHSFENHIEKILQDNDVIFQRGARTEGKQTPDFLFPGKNQYDNPSFDSKKLRMLGAKTSCKERWRQILAEAKRIERKHLITLEPAISEDQTDQMEEAKVQLVIPEPLQKSYSTSQRAYLMSFKDFISEVYQRTG